MFAAENNHNVLHMHLILMYLHIRKVKDIYIKQKRDHDKITGSPPPPWLSSRASDSGATGRWIRNLQTPCWIIEQGTLVPEIADDTQEAVAPFRND